ncbi:hypothetical protein HDV05_003678 [Chytridiales sp. JEL 0842]|nr:hypothetical protein HDV05_003678 [Chytridiales sp. JEL 0842]
MGYNAIAIVDEEYAEDLPRVPPPTPRSNQVKKWFFLAAALGALFLLNIEFKTFLNFTTSKWISVDARQKYRVGPLPWAKHVHPIQESYSGLVHIRNGSDGWTSSMETNKASIFYWYFPALNAPKTDTPPPLIIWLQGGPGSSSMLGLFYEMGALNVNEKKEILRSKFHWNGNFSMLFIDNPVGTGFSVVTPKTSIVQMSNVSRVYQQSEEPVLPQVPAGAEEEYESLPKYSNGFTTNQAAVARDLLLFMDKFYDIFPEQRRARLVITGESYAGKYVPSFAAAILNRNSLLKSMKDSEPKNQSKLIPLTHIAIGNGLTDPVSQIVTHTPQALALGLISKSQAVKVDEFAQSVKGFAKVGAWRNATNQRNEMFEYFKQVTGNINPYDVRQGDVENNWEDMYELLNIPSVKKSLNVPASVVFDKDPVVYEYLADDVIKSCKRYVEYILRSGEVRVLLYQGQFDFRDGVLSQNEWIETLDWDGREEYERATRKIWKFDGHVAGYERDAGALLRRTEVLNAGHLAPMDQGAATLDMISRFILDI